MDIPKIIAQQRHYYMTNETKKIQTRLHIIKTIKRWILANETLILDALKADLNKDPFEGYMCEVSLVLSEINFQLKHLHKWSKKKRVKTPLTQFYGQSYKTYEPYGVTLIMSPWNYPFLLTMDPVIGALGAGNTVVIKPSAYAPHVSALIKQMITECCPEEYVVVIEGSRETNTLLLEQRFDYIFFTGSMDVGKQVMAKASQFLTPITLELGGKSPCLIDDDHHLALAAKRIAFGKFLNAGQTCVAPDYLLIREHLKAPFLLELQKVILDFFGDHPLENDQFGRIVNQKHFDRLLQLLQNQDIVIGGKAHRDTLKIEPTVVDHVTLENALMQEEIFGPILPILTYSTIDEAIALIQQQEKPLACYIFSNQKTIQDHILTSCSFGGGCINDTVIHLATNHLGFGGVGYSGMGSYHGKKSFETFSHTRSIVKKANWIDLPIRYFPYTPTKNKILRLFKNK